MGRAADLLRLLRRVQTRPSLTVVAGETGVGKTSLVNAALGHPDLLEVTRLIGCCRPLQEPLPLTPVVEALAAAAGRLIDVTLSPVAGTLRPLLPELAGELPEPPERVNSAAVERQRLFRGVSEVLAALAPVVLVLEDLHWMDEMTGEFLRHVAARPPEGVALVLTYRPEDLPPPGWQWLAKPGAMVERVDLEPLDVEGVGKLVGALLGSDAVSDEFAGYVHRSTAGLPFAVEEVVRLLADEQQVTLVDGRWVRRTVTELTVPVAVRDTVLARLARLPAVARRAAEALAVLARPSPLELVARTAELSDEHTVAGLAALDRARLLSDRRGRYELRHDLARQACYQAVPAPRRRWMHGRAAEALATDPSPPLAELAHHHREAGATGEWIRFAEEAAAVAAEAGNHAAAVRLLEDTIDAAPEPAGRARLAWGYANAAVQARMHRRVVPVVRRLVDGGGLDPEPRGRLRCVLGALLAQNGDLPAATAQARTAVAELEGTPEAAVAMSYLAWPLSPEVHLDEHLEWARRAVALRPSTIADEAAIRAGVGDPSGWAHGERLVREPPHARLEHLRIPYNLADAALRTGYYERAARLLATLHERTAAAETNRFAAPAAGLCLWLDWARGRWGDLGARADELLEQDEDSPTATTAARFVLGALAVARGNLVTGTRQLADVKDRAVNAGEPVLYLWACGELARVALARDDVQAACAYAEEGLTLVRRKGIWAWCGEPLPWGVAALARRGELKVARGVLREARSGLRGVDAPGAQAAAAFAAGLLAAENDRPRAARYLGDAAEAWEAMPRPHLAALALAERGRLVATDDRRRGVALLTGAHDRLASLGASWDAARVREVLRACGVPATHHRGRRGYGSDLSPRERQVAELAAAGLTNREIAEHLVLSLRTIEHHVSAVLRKLDVRARQDIVLPTTPTKDP